MEVIGMRLLLISGGDERSGRFCPKSVTPQVASMEAQDEARGA
tara:strand:- start:312 stop:440 length:129 start_codon:yes stop_codon:yes gene_type:complete